MRPGRIAIVAVGLAAASSASWAVVELRLPAERSRVPPILVNVVDDDRGQDAKDRTGTNRDDRGGDDPASDQGAGGGTGGSGGNDGAGAEPAPVPPPPAAGDDDGDDDVGKDGAD